jgi:hypothetical protein
MATTLDTLVQRTRRFVRDFPLGQDSLTASITSVATTATVNTGTQFNQSGNQIVEIDYEAFLLKSVSSNTLTVSRAFAGSTAATHASGAAVLINPAFMSVEIIDALNATKDECFPLIYRPVLDLSLSGDGTTYEFTVPNMPNTYGGDSIPIPWISKIEIKENGALDYRPVAYWTIRRGTIPKIRFQSPPPICVMRVSGFGPFPDWSASTDTVDTLWPKNAERPLITGAAARLLASGEAGRVRTIGPRDDREAANRVGSSLAASNDLYQRFQFQLRNAAMAPMPPHVVSVL